MNSKSIFCVRLLGTSALTFVLATSAALAQTAQPAAPAAGASSSSDETIVVTGIRGALQNAAQIKRNASTFVDSITASDVSALPDTNVSEALGRIPGISVTRYSYGGSSPDFPSAEGSGNLIRGLSFVRSEFNGRDEFTANGGRALDWSAVPPELVGGVDVYKNSSAELIEGGIGGTINLRTLEPFDRRGAVFAISGDATYADLREKWSPSFSVIASNRWQTSAGEFGLMASYSDSKLDSNINDWQQGAPVPRLLTGETGTVPGNLGGAGGNPTLGAEDVGGAAKFTGQPASNIIGTMPVFQLRHNEQDRDRSSYYLAAQWQNEHTRATFKYVGVRNATNTVEHTVEHLPGYGDVTNTTFGSYTSRPYSGTVALCNTGSPSPATICNAQIPIGSLMTSGTFTSDADATAGMYGYQINTLGRGVVDRSHTEDYSLNIQHEFNERLHLNFDVQYTTADASQSEVWGGGQTHFMVTEVPGLDHPTVSFVEDPRGNGIHQVKSILSPTAASASTANAGTYFWLYAFNNAQKGTGHLWAERADLAYDFPENNWFKDVKFGVRYSERTQINDQANGNWSGVGCTWCGGGGATPFSALPSNMIEADNFRNFFRGGLVQGANDTFLYINRSFLLNYNKLAAFITANRGPGGIVEGSPWQAANPLFPASNRSDITEKTEAAYLQFDYAHEIGGGQSIEGNFGVRYVNRDEGSAGNLVRTPFGAESPCTDNHTDSNGVWTTPTGCEHNSQQDFLPQTTAYLQVAAQSLNYSTSDRRWLPSFNLKWNLNDQMLIRFAASQALTPPNVSDLRAFESYSAGTATTNWPANHCSTFTLPAGATTCNDGVQNISLSQINAGGGNPRLKPTTADNYDLSYEWYFSGGYVSAAVFDKKLHDIINFGTERIGTVTLDGYTVPINYSGQVNTQSATVKGAEIAYQQFYDFLPGLLSHLGVQANFTYIDARVDQPNANCSAAGGPPCRYGLNDLYGQSKYIANLVGIYQDEHFEARLAYNWRSHYLVSYGDYMTSNPIFNDDAGFLDGSLKYNLNEHLQLSGSVENMLDTHNKAYMQVDQAGATLDRYSVLNDRRFVLGFRYQY